MLQIDPKQIYNSTLRLQELDDDPYYKSSDLVRHETGWSGMKTG